MQVAVAYSVEHYGVNIIEYDMLFYHVYTYFFCKITKSF